MTPQLWLAVATFFLGGPITFVGFMLKKVYDVGQETAKLENRFKMIEGSVLSLVKRMDEAGLQMSNFATNMQGLPERVRREMSGNHQAIGETRLMQEQNLKDHRGFDDRINELRTQSGLPKRRAHD